MSGKTCTKGTTAMQEKRENQQPMAPPATMADRLAKVRGQMTDSDFARLIADMGRTAERFVEIDASAGATLPAEPHDPRPGPGVKV
jgi:hypothetical protein